jgi:hypothetical protein
VNTSTVTLFRVITASLLAVALAACGPNGGGNGDDDDDDTNGPDASTLNCPNPVAEVCNNGLDDDCDNIMDCDDSDCSADSHCANPNCGVLDGVEGTLLPLPDEGCPEDLSQPCAGFENAINFTGFTDGQTLNDITKLKGVCVNMEHSWMRDLVIYIRCPNGTRVNLSAFEGHSGGEVFLGFPNEGAPVPGTGSDYCWTPTATNLSWIPYANANAVGTLPPGDYQSSQPLNGLLGCPLNGAWTIRVEDRWGIDNGFIFKWTVKFDASIVEDCAHWPG